MNSDYRSRLQSLNASQRLALARQLEVEIPTQSELVAFIGARETVDEETLREFLRERLPPYMVPRRFVVLDQLPRTPNGKVDRQQLLTLQPPARARQSEQLLDATESELAAIWASLLDIEQVGRDDDFFDLGGHSLLAMRLFSEIERQFGKNLPLSTILERPTVGLLADAVRTRVTPEANPCLVTLQQGQGRAPLFCIHEGGGNILHYRDLATLLGKERPVIGILPRGLDGVSSVQRSVVDMAQLYADWMITSYPTGPYLVCGYSFGGTVAYEVACQLRAAGREVAFCGVFDAPVYGTLSIKDSVPGYLDRLQSLSVRQKIRQVTQSTLGHASSFLRDGVRELKRRAKLAPAYLYIARGRPLPVKLQPVYLRNFYGPAMLDYVPRSYDGVLSVYWQRSGVWEYRDRPDLGWGEFVQSQNLRLHELPGGHGDMLKKPLVTQVASSMREQLANY